MYKLQKIDEFSREKHKRLTSEDQCYYFGEYYSGKRYQHHDFNQLLFNFKKETSRKNKPDWRYKIEAIDEMANIIYQCPAWEKIKHCLWIPIPPSKMIKDTEYDNRLLQVLQKLKNLDNQFNFVDCITLKKSRTAAHLNIDNRHPTPEEHLQNFIFHQDKIACQPKAIIIFDDLVTTGSSFVAAKMLIKNYFPKIPIFGLFLGRRVIDQ